MAISQNEKKNMKTFVNSGGVNLASSELGIIKTDFNKVLITKDERFFFAIYDKLLNAGFISDEKRRLKLPNGIDDDIDTFATPPPKAKQLQITLAKPKPAPTLASTDVSALETKKPKVRYNLLIDEDLLERLKVESLEVDRSVSSLIRISIINYLDKKRASK